MKYHIIINLFKDSGIWPMSIKKGLKRIRVYKNKRKRTLNDLKDEDNDHQLELPLYKRQATELSDTFIII
jgi:hypothetical protein